MYYSPTSNFALTTGDDNVQSHRTGMYTGQAHVANKIPYLPKPQILTMKIINVKVTKN